MHIFIVISVIVWPAWRAAWARRQRRTRGSQRAAATQALAAAEQVNPKAESAGVEAVKKATIRSARGS
jgi:hypothetical protein